MVCGGFIQAARRGLTTIYWGLLKQPDKQKSSTLNPASFKIRTAKPRPMSQPVWTRNGHRDHASLMPNSQVATGLSVVHKTLALEEADELARRHLRHAAFGNPDRQLLDVH